MMKLLSGLLFFVVCCAAAAQPSEIKKLAGYVDFGKLTAVYGEPKVRINIGEKLLRFVGMVAEEEDADTAAVLSKLDAVRVEVYKLNENLGPAIDAVTEVSGKLESQDWEPVVSVSEDNEEVRIFVKINKDVIDGLVVMAVDGGDEAVFINIIGEIDPAQVGKVTRALDIDLEI